MAGLMDVASATAKQFGVTKTEARKMIEFVCGDITRRMAAGESVNIRNFGVFKCKEMKERNIKSPQDKSVEVTVPATVRVLFTPAEATKMELKYQKGLITEEAYEDYKKKQKRTAVKEEAEEEPADSPADAAEEAAE